MPSNRWKLVPFLGLFVLAGPLAAAGIPDCGQTSLPTNDAPNLLVNPSFELDGNADNKPDGWSDRPSALRITTTSHSDSASLAPMAVQDGVSQDLALLPSTTYTISAYVKTDAVVGIGVRLNLRELDANVSRLSPLVGGTSDWTKISLTFISSTVQPAVGRFIINYNYTAGALWVDDVAMCLGFGPCGPPVVSSLSPSHGTNGAAKNDAVLLSFSEKVRPDSLATSLSVRQVRDHAEAAVNVNVSGALTPAAPSNAFVFTPSLPLKGNSIYRVTVASGLLDVEGVPSQRAVDGCFRTLFDPAVDNVVSDVVTGAGVSMAAGSLGVEGSIHVSSGTLSDAAFAAAEKTAAATRDPLRRPVGLSMVDFELRDALGAPLAQPFTTPVTVFLSYTDADNDGVVDGTDPPVRVKTLGIAHLDEERAVWVRLPSSSVDTAARRVSARTAHFSAFALMGQSDTDLSGVQVFPLPFRANQGHRAIVFSGLGQGTTIRLYTITGDLVREISTPLAAGQVEWDTRNSRGEPVTSGVYPYLMESGSNRKRGKVMIIR